MLIDGSPFRWYDDAQPCTLLGAVDDASGEILALVFRPTEDLHGYVTLIHQVVRQHGVPLALYGDRSGILIRSDPYWTEEEERAGRQTPTQFGTMLEELGIGFIAAHSPQAKGRIERLWATLQDRLASELRLLGHATLNTAYDYLPKFIAKHNRACGSAPVHPSPAFRPAPRDLAQILACRYPRVVARDNTISIPGRWAQIPPGPRQRSWHAARVEVREQLDGQLLVLHPRHGVIAEQAPPAIPFTLESRGSARARGRQIPGYAQKPKITRSKTLSPKPKSERVGNFTNVRRPHAQHPWKGRYPQPPAHPPGGG